MLSRLNDQLFYKNTNIFFKILLIFVIGDIIVLLPLVLIIFLTIFISQKLFLLLLFSYIIIRGCGEMIYWIFRQYYRAYGHRPYDFGLKNLGNKAIYILYQTGAIVLIMLGLTGLYLVLFGD